MRLGLLAVVCALACATPVHSSSYDGVPEVPSVSSLSPEIYVSISNETINVARVYVLDELGNIIRSTQVGPQSRRLLKIPRADIHSGMILFHAGSYESDLMSVFEFDSFEVRLDAHSVFSEVTGYHGSLT